MEVGGSEHEKGKRKNPHSWTAGTAAGKARDGVEMWVREDERGARFT